MLLSYMCVYPQHALVAFRRAIAARVRSEDKETSKCYIRGLALEAGQPEDLLAVIILSSTIYIVISHLAACVPLRLSRIGLLQSLS